MRSLKKRGPHVLNDLNDLLKLLTIVPEVLKISSFGGHYYISSCR